MKATPLLIPDGQDPSKTHTLWALDLDNNGYPVLAHRIVNIERRHRKTQPDPEETRVTACGMRLTVTNHPHGWWYVVNGELPIQVQYCHCGVTGA